MILDFSVIANYLAFIQLAVAFNFAFVAFGNKLEEKRIIFKINRPFYVKNKTYIQKIEEEIIKELNSVVKTTLYRDIYAREWGYYKQRIKGVMNLILRLKYNQPYYLGPVSMIVGIYCIFQLLFIPELECSVIRQHLYSFYSIIMIISLLIYLKKEFNSVIFVWKNCRDLEKIKEFRKKDREYLKPIFIIAIFLSLFPLINSCEKLSNFIDLNYLFYASLVIPYIAFIVCFMYYFLGLIIVYICYLWINMLRFWYKFKIEILYFILKQLIPTESKYQDIQSNIKKDNG